MKLIDFSEYCDRDLVLLERDCEYLDKKGAIGNSHLRSVYNKMNLDDGHVNISFTVIMIRCEIAKRWLKEQEAT